MGSYASWISGSVHVDEICLIGKVDLTTRLSGTLGVEKVLRGRLDVRRAAKLSINLIRVATEVKLEGLPGSAESFACS